MPVELVMYKNHLGGTGFESMKRTLRVAEVWHCESPGSTISKDTALVSVDGPGLRDHANELKKFSMK